MHSILARPEVDAQRLVEQIRVVPHELLAELTPACLIRA
jgi:hypothetical protein